VQIMFTNCKHNLHVAHFETNDYNLRTADINSSAGTGMKDEQGCTQCT